MYSSLFSSFHFEFNHRVSKLLEYQIFIDLDTPFFRKEDIVKHENVSLFGDKYETDITEQTVANRMADLVINFEKYHNIIEEEIDLENIDDSSGHSDYSSDEEDENNNDELVMDGIVASFFLFNSQQQRLCSGTKKKS